MFNQKSKIQSKRSQLYSTKGPSEAHMYFFKSCFERLKPKIVYYRNYKKFDLKRCQKTATSD